AWSAPINARRPRHARTCALSPAGRARRGELEPAFLLATTGDRVLALQAALAKQPWMRHRSGATGDGRWGRADGADGRPRRPTERRARRAPRRSRPDDTGARRGRAARPANLERRCPRSRRAPALPRIAEARRG